MPDASRELAELGRRLAADGYVVGRDGNLSARVAGDILITTSGVPKEKLTDEDVVPITDARRRSSEWAVHDAIYRARPDVAAVIHAHPLYATVLAVRGEALEPLLDEVAPVLGGRIEVAAYAPSGGEELARNVVAALGGRHAVLLARHGSVTTGATLEEAFHRLQVLERAALVQVLR
jgi:L-fuculose-phosphate aldolase